MNRHLYPQIRTIHVLSVIVVFAISAGILLAAQSGCIGATLAGTDGSYDTPDTGLSEHAPVQAVTAWEGMSNLIVACQIADTFADMLFADMLFADMLFTGVLDAAYAVHAVLSLTAVGNITDDSSLVLGRASDITTFVSGGHTYAAVAAYTDYGVQILNVTNLSNITAAGNIRDVGESTADLELRGARGITTFESGGHTYAAVAAHLSDSVQILNVTDPSSITFTGHITDTTSLELEGAVDITTFVSGSHTYAAVAASVDDGVQILNVTDPSNITPTGHITDTPSLELWDARGITIFELGVHTYAAVAAYEDDGVQILNVTDPTNITAAGSITDTDTLVLDGASGITTFVSGGHTYAAVAAYEDDGVQILNVTDPTNITAAGSSIDTNTLKLNGAQDITTFTSGDHTYVAVTANRDNGVQILDVTDPLHITAAGNIADIGNNTDDLELYRAQGITTFTSDGHIYAAVAAYEDDGVQIIRIDIPPDTTLPADAFVTTWKTESADQSITINFVGDDMNISWGDGTTETNLSGPQTHIYTKAGNYTVSVTGGLTGLTLDRPKDFLGFPGLVPELASIDQWGGISWTNMSNAFAGASNMVYNAGDAPDLSGVTDMSNMFGSATSFDGDLSDWNVSSVTDMFNMFRSATSFNQPLNDWDVSSVTDMTNMFIGATSFNQPLNSWDVSSVIYMSSMFFSATSFDGTLSGWNVSSVTNMNEMFAIASAFNGDISGWNVSAVTSMNGMFFDATSFNQPLNSWDVSRVTNMDDMFFGATSFDQNLGNWYVTLDPDTIADTGIPGVVGTISAQNQPLKNHSPTYVIVDGLDKNHFEIVPGNQLNMISGVSGKAEYSVNVTASGGSVFESGNNWRLLEIKVTGQTTDTTPPVIKLEGSSLVTITVDETYTEQGAVCDDDVDADKPATVGGDTVDTSTVGQYTVTYDCTDSSNNEATQVSRTVNVQSAPDTDAPVIIITGLTNIQLTVDETYTEQGAVCDDDVDADKPATVGGDTVDTSTVGQYTVTYDCTDSSNNEATQVSRTVNVQSAPDTDAPVIIITGLTNIQLTVDETYTEQGAVCDDDVDADKPATVGGDTVDTSTVGQYTVTYDCTDSSNNEATQVSRTVNVQSAPDTDAPVIIITGLTNIQLTVDETYTEQGAVCDDDVDADKPATVGGDTVDTSTVGQYTVTYDCTDSSNNEATQVSRTVNVQSAPDTDAPVIIITGSANIQLTVDETYTEQGAVCDDDVDADKPATVGGDTVDTSTVGQYTVTYDCTDSSNNEATQVSRTVNVQSAPDTDAPVIIITGSANIQLTVDETYTEQGAVCDDDVDADKPATVGGDTVDTSTVGQYTVTYDCTDSSNNEATQVSRTVNVQSAPDTDAPVIIITGSANIQLTVDETYTEQGAVCDDDVDADKPATVGGDTVDTSTVGQYTVTYDCTDSSNNEATQVSRTVIVQTAVTPRITLSADAFITTWRTDSANQTITIPVGGSTARYSIDWGDNSPAETDITGDSTHTYRKADSYTVSISGGLERFHLDGQQPNAGRLASIEQWGDTRWTTMDAAFDGATNMVYRATDTPDLSGVTDMHRMFGDATAFNGDLSSWDVSKVTDMSNMFIFAYDFNGNLSSWNVSSVTNMNEMFAVATSFNQPLNSWNVSRVTNMDDMFYFATAFSQNLGNWYVVANATSIARADVPGVVAEISAQNDHLNGHNPTYGISRDNDYAFFEIVNGNKINMTSVGTKSSYMVNVTASGSNVFEDGNNWRMLVVRVTGDNNADLGGLTISSGTLSPQFSSSDITYTASVDNSVTQVTVTPTASDSLAAITVNGNDVTSGTGYILTGLTVGEPNTVTVIVTAQDSTTKTYIITLTRAAALSDNADLGSLTISSGTLSPQFSSSDITYTASVDNSVTQVTVTPTASDSLATITVNDNTVTSGNGYIVIGLIAGEPNTVTVIVTAQDSTTKTYIITLTRAASLSDNADLGSLTISSGTLSPQFSSSDITYTASVDNSVTQVTVTPTASDSLATITVNGNDVTSGTGYILTGLTVDEPNTVTVIVTAQDSTTKTYTITLTRAASLSDNADLGSLTISSGTLSPQFSSSDITYTASVDNSVTQVTVTPTASDSLATITVNGNTVTSGTGYILTGLTVDEPNTVTVIVTAQDSTTKTYTITLTRAASLSDNADLGGLTISSGTLSPQFSSSDITYTASVANSVTQVTVTSTASDSSAAITVNGNTVTSGTGYILTGLNVDEPNTVTVIVTAQDSTTKTYTITLTRAAALSDNADLGGLTISSGTLSPQFSSSDITYTASVANSVTQVTVTPTASDSLATITVNDNTVTSGNGYILIGLIAGEPNTVTVIVTAQDSTTKTYTVTVTVRDVPITVSSAAYNPGNGQLTITFNQDIATVDYSGLHVRSSANPDTGGITLSSVTGVDYSGRTITATLDSEQQDQYDALQSPHLVVEDGAVTDTDGDRTTDVPPQPIRDASQKGSSSSPSSKAPIVHINALAQSRLVDIPSHIAEQVESHDASDPLEPITPDDTFDLPLVINGYGYLLDAYENTLIPQTVTAGDNPVHITFTVYTEKEFAHFTLYLNLQGRNTNYADSDTYITYKDDGTTSVTDPHGYIGSATVTVTQEDNQIPEKRTVSIIVEFEEPMGSTNMVAYMWNTDREALFVKIIDALEVVAASPESAMQAADPEPLEPDSVLPADPEPVTPDFADDAADPEPVPYDILGPDDYDDTQILQIIRMWSGFESESITDEQLLELLGLDDHQGADIPDWMMTELGVLVAKGTVTVDEFLVALQYVLEHV